MQRIEQIEAGLFMPRLCQAIGRHRPHLTQLIQRRHPNLAQPSGRSRPQIQLIFQRTHICPTLTDYRRLFTDY